MAQRLLLGFDALDKYSEDIMAKHAKKYNLSYMQRIQSLSIPLSFDFELESHQDSAGNPSEAQRNSHLSSRNPIHNERAKPGIRPFTAAGICTIPDSGEEERDSMKVTKPRCFSATRRRPWRCEVESIPNLDTLCQEENNTPILSVLSVTDRHSRSSFLSPREPLPNAMTPENSHLPPGQDEMGTEGTPALSDKSRYGSAKNITDTKHPSRGKIQEATAVSLSIEDEMKKSDVKIITVRHEMEGAGVESVSQTHPVIYNNQDKLVSVNTLSDLRRNLITKPNYFSSCQNALVPPRANSVLQNHTGFIKNSQSVLDNATLKKTQSNKASFSNNMKVISHFLSADGTKEKVEFAKDGKVSKEKQIKSQDNRKTCVQDVKPIFKSVPTCETRDELGHVGPTINGMNPKKTVDNIPAAQSRSHHVSRASGPNSARATSSQSLRPNSGGEILQLSYISISKPLSPAGGHLGSLQNNYSVTITSADIMEDTVRPASGRRHASSPVTFTTRPVVLESRNGRRGSVQAEPNALGAPRIPGYFGEETEKECSEIVQLNTASCTPTVIELWEISSSPKDDCNEEQVKTPSPVPGYLSTIPVISIPTAPIDNSD